MGSEVHELILPYLSVAFVSDTRYLNLFAPHSAGIRWRESPSTLRRLHNAFFKIISITPTKERKRKVKLTVDVFATQNATLIRTSYE